MNEDDIIGKKKYYYQDYRYVLVDIPFGEVLIGNRLYFKIYV